MPTKNANILQLFFLHSGFCVSKVIYFFPFLLDIFSIVAKTTKILVRIPYFKSIVPHIKNKNKNQLFLI